MGEEYAISKYEFVRRYVPHASKSSVCYWFRRNVHSNERLMQQLAVLGYKKHHKSLTSRMCRLIEYRGMPE